MILVNRERLLSAVWNLAWLVSFSVCLTLFLTERSSLLPPCGSMIGCEAVLTSTYTKLFGISNAVLGFSFTCLLGVVRCLRLSKPDGEPLKSAASGLAAMGWVVSAYLTYIAITRVHALCPYCLANLLGLTVIAGLELVGTPPKGKLIGFSLWIAGALVLPAIVIPNSQPAPLTLEGAEIAKLLPKAPFRYVGNSSAKATILVITDPECGSCRACYPKLSALVTHNPAVRLAVVLRPLPDLHPTSWTTCLAASIFSESNKLDDFLKAWIAQPYQSDPMPLVLKLAKDQGIEGETLKRRLKDRLPVDYAVRTVQSDLDQINKLKIVDTPSFFLIEGKKAPRSVSWGDLQDLYPGLK